MKNAILLVSAVLLVLLTACSGVRIKEHEGWKKYFDAYGVEGCFEIYDNNKEIARYYNKERTAERFSPASTFKIFNSLVALETGEAQDEQLMIPWDGVEREIPSWNQDLTMKEAFKYSAVPYYQELARRLGRETLQFYLDSVKYGNMNMEGDITMFWLNDTLKISADEQVGLMKRLYHNQLPFTERTHRIVKGMMLQEATDDYRLYYKTGLGRNGDGSRLLWVVGFIEQYNPLKNVETGTLEKIPHPYFFALNFTAPAGSDKDWLTIRMKLLRDLLKESGLNIRDAG